MNALDSLVSQYLATTDQRTAERLAFDISELLYDEPTLEPLSRLFTTGKSAHRRTLSALLYEHSDRADEAAPWLSEMLNSADESVRFASVACALEANPAQHRELLAEAISRVRDRPSIAALVATYLTGAPESDLRSVSQALDDELQGQIQWLLDPAHVGIEERLRSSGVRALVAVAAAGRLPSDRAELLRLAERSDDEAVQLAAHRVAQRQAGR